MIDDKTKRQLQILEEGKKKILKSKQTTVDFLIKAGIICIQDRQRILAKL